MKSPLFTLLLSVPLFCFGQIKKDTTYIYSGEITGMVLGLIEVKEMERLGSVGYWKWDDSTRISIDLWSNGKMDIHGDTMNAVRYLFEKYQEMEERYWKAKLVLNRINIDKSKSTYNNKYFSQLVNEYLKTEERYNSKSPR